MRRVYRFEKEVDKILKKFEYADSLWGAHSLLSAGACSYAITDPILKAWKDLDWRYYDMTQRYWLERKEKAEEQFKYSNYKETNAITRLADALDHCLADAIRMEKVGSDTYLDEIKSSELDCGTCSDVWGGVMLILVWDKFQGEIDRIEETRRKDPATYIKYEYDSEKYRRESFSVILANTWRSEYADVIFPLLSKINKMLKSEAIKSVLRIYGWTLEEYEEWKKSGCGSGAAAC